jgi:hypothetical protein
VYFLPRLSWNCDPSVSLPSSFRITMWITSTRLLGHCMACRVNV